MSFHKLLFFQNQSTWTVDGVTPVTCTGTMENRLVHDTNRVFFFTYAKNIAEIRDLGSY